MEFFDMKLKDQPFTKIKNKKKTIELRLYDDKRRQLDIGDYIVFTSLENGIDQIAVKIKGLFRADSFLELFEDISIEISLTLCLREKIVMSIVSRWMEINL